MEQLAKRTGGEVLRADRLDAFAARMPSLRAPVTETVTDPLWHTPWFFLFAVTCLLVEWGLRRRAGLA
jgi:hypothetical protein